MIEALISIYINCSEEFENVQVNRIFCPLILLGSIQNVMTSIQMDMWHKMKPFFSAGDNIIPSLIKIIPHFTRCWYIFSDSILASKITNIWRETGVLPSYSHSYKRKRDTLWWKSIWSIVSTFIFRLVHSWYNRSYRIIWILAGEIKLLSFVRLSFFYYLEWIWFVQHQDTKHILAQIFQPVFFKCWISKW